MLLLYLNLRGMKESIRVLLPIFLGFVFTHALLIVYGVGGVIGGHLLGFLALPFAGLAGSIIVATIGAILLVAVVRVIKKA